MTAFPRLPPAEERALREELAKAGPEGAVALPVRTMRLLLDELDRLRTQPAAVRAPEAPVPPPPTESLL